MAVRTPRRTPRALIAVAVAALGLGLVPPPPASAAPGTCAQVVMLGARGSGQAAGAGAQLEGTFRALQQARPDLTMELRPIPYPAVGAEVALLDPDAFVASITRGVRAMRQAAKAVADACPATQVVLAGFSQGAMVTHEAILDRATVRRATAILLLADGFRTRRDRVAYLPGGPERSRGVVTANARDAAPGPVPVTGGKALGMCLAGDVVCDWTATADLGTGLRLHSTGYLLPAVQAQAAAGIAARLAP